MSDERIELECNRQIDVRNLHLFDVAKVELSRKEKLYLCSCPMVCCVKLVGQHLGHKLLMLQGFCTTGSLSFPLDTE